MSTMRSDSGKAGPQEDVVTTEKSAGVGANADGQGQGGGQAEGLVPAEKPYAQPKFTRKPIHAHLPGSETRPRLLNAWGRLQVPERGDADSSSSRERRDLRLRFDSIRKVIGGERPPRPRLSSILRSETTMWAASKKPPEAGRLAVIDRGNWPCLFDRAGLGRASRQTGGPYGGTRFFAREGARDRSHATQPTSMPEPRTT